MTIWSQSIARETLLRQPSQNPSLAARALLGLKGAAGYARRVPILRGKRRRPFFRENLALPAAALLGGIPGVGRKFDPKKHAQRIARIDAWAAQAMAGKAVDYHVQVLTDIANGAPTALVATYDEIRAYAAAKLAPILAAQEKQAERQLELKAEARERAAASSARETRFLEAGTSVAGALASAVGRRGARRPARRRRRPRYDY